MVRFGKCKRGLSTNGDFDAAPFEQCIVSLQFAVDIVGATIAHAH
jgi:hypothetical protein